MFCCLDSSFAGIFKFRKNINKASRYVTRDELETKHKRGVAKGATESVYKRDMKHASTHIHIDDNQNRGIVRVKVVMTKAEAMKLFSKCDGSGTLSFENVTTELTKVPVNRVSLVDHPWSPSNEVMMLESIPEEP